MKVIKVIVDELPEYCAECRYREVVTAQRGEKCRFGWHKIDDSLIRPDWCPLMPKDELTSTGYDNEYIVDFEDKEGCDD